LLEQLRGLLARKGRLSGLLIDEEENLPSSSVYRHRFSSLVQAYKLIAYNPERDYQFIETNRQLRLMYPKVVADVAYHIRELGGVIHTNPSSDLMTVNNEFTASLVIARCTQRASGSFRWLIRLDTGLLPDITVAVRMDSENSSPLDYYLLPSIDLRFQNLTLNEQTPLDLDVYRFETLDFFFGMARRTQIPEAA